MKIKIIEHEIEDKIKYPNEYMLELEIKGQETEVKYFIDKLNLFIKDYNKGLQQWKNIKNI